MESATAPLYHVLLVGIDAYPPRYSSLGGCVNDIDAIEALLLDPPGVGVPAEQIRVQRLAALRPNRVSTSRLQNQTLAPSRDNLVQALKDLAGPEVRAGDRVLIYYSGHGDEKLFQGSDIYHESLVPHDGVDIQRLYDIEINALINAIAARSDDLTIVLDCCHSAGASKDLTDIEAQGADRFLGGDDAPDAPPDVSALGATDGGAGGMLHGLDPDYVVLAACQPYEKAGEGVAPGELQAHGLFTSSLVSLLRGRNADERSALRWADIWPDLLDRVALRATQMGRRPQHPSLIGRSERHIFGGPWQEQDPGYSVALSVSGVYTVGAGTLMGVTHGAEIAVYGPTPARFPPVGSTDDHPLGRLRVVAAERSRATAVPVDMPFQVPLGARGRLVRPGDSERLKVRLVPDDPDLARFLSESPLLEMLAENAPDAEVEVVMEAGSAWRIGNDVETRLAVVPVGEVTALRGGLDAYFRYNATLYLARACNDPQLAAALSLRLLDASDAEALAALTDAQLLDPPLAEVHRDADAVYAVEPGTRFCVKVANASTATLHVTVLNCSVGGLVEMLGTTSLRPGVSDVLWQAGQFRRGFRANPDRLPGVPSGTPPSDSVVDRLVAIGTTRPDVDLGYLRVAKTVQQVVDELLGSKGVLDEPSDMASGPSELWTATVAPLRIRRARGG